MRADVVALAGAAVLLMMGVVRPVAMQGAFASPAIVALASLFVIAYALELSGLLDRAIERAVAMCRRLGTAGVWLLSMIGGVTCTLNSTPIVVLGAPVVRDVATVLGQSPKCYLVPLSYVTILTGCCASIGNAKVFAEHRPLQLLFGALGSVVPVGGVRLTQESTNVGALLDRQMKAAQSWLRDSGVPIGMIAPKAEESDRAGAIFSNPAALLPGDGSIASRVLGFVSVVLGYLGNALVVIFLGLFIAAQPSAYRSGILRFIPRRHVGTAAATLDDMGETLRRWLTGQLTTMSVIFAVTWAGLTVIGVPAAFLLAIQAGLLAFIPNIGPIVAGIVIVAVALTGGIEMALYAVGLYVLVQTLESYILTPFIQRQALSVPPATLFAAQILLGVIFGLWGLALALPMVAILKVLLDQLYLPDQASSGASG